MIDENEEISAFYPEQFRVDATQGIKYIYSEAILPEIDTSVLLKKVKEVEDKLSPTEKKRNMIRKKVFIL